MPPSLQPFLLEEEPYAKIKDGFIYEYGLTTHPLLKMNSCSSGDDSADCSLQSRSDWAVALSDCVTKIASGRCGVEQALQRLIRVLLPTAGGPRKALVERTEAIGDCGPSSFSAREEIPSSVLKSVALQTMHLSLASGDHSRNATLLWDIARERGVLASSPQLTKLASERASLSYMRGLIEAGDWAMACDVFHKCVASDIGLAVGVEAYAAGRRWEEAIELLGAMSNATDRELALVLASMFQVARQARRVNAIECSTLPEDPLVTSESLWRTALLVTSAFVRGKLTSNHSTLRSAAPIFSSPSAVTNLLGVLGCFKRWNEALLVATESVKDIANHSDHSVMGMPLLNNENRVTLNVVGLSQLCYALQPRWDIALSLSSRLVGGGSVRFEDLDAVAMQRMLRCCLSGRRWVEATRIVEAWRQRYHLGRPAELKSNPPVLHVDHCLKLLQLLGCSSEATGARESILHDHLLSRATNSSTKSRALNAMIQSAHEATTAAKWSQELSSLGLAEENESLAHRVELCSRAGMWLESLQLCHVLLDERCHRGVGSYVPSSTLHDWAQYAVNVAPSPGPTWDVSVALFSRMVTAHVPLTDVSFQAVVRRCFSQGAAQQANNVFAVMMKRGVGRK